MGRKAKERRRRFGWIFSRKSAEGVKTFYAQWQEGPGGKRITRSVGSEAEAAKYLDTIEARMWLGTYALPPTAAESDAQPERPVAPSAPLLVDYSAAQLAGRLAVKSESTRACYSANHKALAAYFGERSVATGPNETRVVPAKRLDAITVTDAIDYRSWRRSVRFEVRNGERRVVEPRKDEAGNEIPMKPISASAANRDLQYLSMILGFAVAEGLASRNPLVGLKMEREERRVRRYLAKSEVTGLILACDAWLRPLVVAALFTGCRGAELKELRWGDVDFEGGKLTIYRTKVRRGDRLDLHPVLAEELRRVRAGRRGAKPNEYVFLNKDEETRLYGQPTRERSAPVEGTPYRDVRKAWSRAVARAGLAGRAGLTFHALRHTFATFFLSNGGAVTDLQGQLGHSKLATTQVYAAMVNERRRSTVLALDYGALTQRPVPSAGGESGDAGGTPGAAASGG